MMGRLGGCSAISADYSKSYKWGCDCSICRGILNKYLLTEKNNMNDQ